MANSAICGHCRASIELVWDDHAGTVVPQSLYWIGTPKRVDTPLCGPECSLAHHESTKGNSGLGLCWLAADRLSQAQKMSRSP